jgi:hypothetical protein
LGRRKALDSRIMQTQAKKKIHKKTKTTAGTGRSLLEFDRQPSSADKKKRALAAVAEAKALIAKAKAQKGSSSSQPIQKASSLLEVVTCTGVSIVWLLRKSNGFLDGMLGSRCRLRRGQVNDLPLRCGFVIAWLTLSVCRRQRKPFLSIKLNTLVGRKTICSARRRMQDPEGSVRRLEVCYC